MPFHAHAALAAEAAQEVFAQKGASAFWEYHDLLFAAQAKDGLERPNLERLAWKLGVDLKRFGAAVTRAVAESELANGPATKP